MDGDGGLLDGIAEEQQPCNQWELSKENIQPLRRGRKMESLNNALQSVHSDEAHRRLAVKKSEFENALRIYSGNDPLEPWISYIEWTEQHFPKNGVEGSLHLLIQKCITEFRDEDKYKNDERFVNICIKLANMATDPLEVYAFMYGMKTGFTVASFYVRWAHALEAAGNVKKADQVFLRGLKNEAEPKQLLELRHKEFMSRLVNRPSENSSAVRSHQTLEEQRSAMSTLKSFGRKHVVGMARTGDAIAVVDNQEMQFSQESRNENKVGRITVRVDESNANNDVLADVGHMESRSSILSTVGQDSRKENEMNPGKWAGVKFSQKTVAATPVTFDVHRDELPAAALNTPQVIRPGVPVLSETKSVKNDALNVLRCSAAMTRHYPNNPSEVSMYRKDLVYGGVEEFQFEEVRAAIYMKRIAERKKDELMREQSARIKQMEQEMMKMKEQHTKILNFVLSNLQSKGVPPSPNLVKQIMRQMGRDATEQDIMDVTILYETEQLSRMEETADECVTDVPVSDPLPSKVLKEASVSATPIKPPAFPAPSTGNRSVFSATPTLNTAEAMKIAMALFNKPNSVCETSVIPQESTSSHRQLQFEVYVDPEVDAIREAMPLRTLKDSKDVDSEVLQQLPCEVYVEPTETESTSQCNRDQEKRRTPSRVRFDLNHQELQPFQVYVDSESYDEAEYDENIPPHEYVQKENQRPLTGILTSSVNVPFIPLEEQKNDSSEEDVTSEQKNEQSEGSEEENDADGTLHVASNGIGLQSFVMPANTLFFTKNAKLVSTPVNLRPPVDNASVSAPVPENIISEAIPIDESLVPLAPFVKSVNFVSDASSCTEQMQIRGTFIKIGTDCLRRSFAPGEKKCLDLSAIIETSRDCKSSSSGSSGASSTAASHLRSTFLRSKTLGDLSSVHERRDESQVVVEPEYRPNLSLTAEDSAATANRYADPFDSHLITNLLAGLKTPLSNRNGVTIIRGQMPVFSTNSLITVHGESYLVESKIGEGSYANIFKISCTVNNSSTEGSMNLVENMVLKVQIPGCPWEFYIADELQQRLKKLQFPIDISSSIMQIPVMYIFNDGSVFTTDWHKCNLLDLINEYAKKNETMPEVLVIYFTIEILHIVEQFHACQIIHADVKPDNFLILDVPPVQLDNSGTPFGPHTRLIKLIDYGRCIDMSCFPSGTEFTAHVDTECFDCIEMKEGRPWSYQTDLYGIAACAHVMLFGKYMTPQRTANDDKWQISEKIRRYWQTDIWKHFFNSLLNVPDSNQLPDLATLRHSLELCLVNSKKYNSKFKERISELRKIYGQLRL